MNFFKKMLIKSIINEKRVKVIIDLFAIAIYADRNIHTLEISQTKINIKNFVDKYYFFLQDFKKELLSEYIYEKVIEKLNMERKNPNYIDYLLKEFAMNTDFVKDDNLKRFLLDMFEDILLSDKIYTKEEKEYFNKIKKILDLKEEY